MNTDHHARYIAAIFTAIDRNYATHTTRRQGLTNTARRDAPTMLATAVCENACMIPTEQIYFLIGLASGLVIGILFAFCVAVWSIIRIVREVKK